jgi:hypothetical protein
MPDRREFLRHASMAGAGAALTAGPALAVQADAGGGGLAATGAFAQLVASSEAPQSMKDAADFVCTGTNDQRTINQALVAASPGANGLGGAVALSPGRFNCSAAVKVRRRTALVGSGRASIIRATRSWSGGLIEAATNGTDKVTVSNLGLDGEYTSVHGIYFNITTQDFDDGSPDAANYITDVYIHATGGNGVHITGSRARAGCVTRVRVWDAGGHGFLINSPDGFYHQCESGSSGKNGFAITSANNRITNCKAWYADRNGFVVSSVRNQLAACESQDNERHGFYLGSGQVTLTSCHADSNSWNRDNPVVRYSGFQIKRYRSWVQLIGCQAYDKNESGRGFWQRWGFFLEGNNSNCQITGIGRDNVDGAIGYGPSVSGNSIDVLGN